MVSNTEQTGCCGGEFQYSNFKLNFDKPQLFVSSQVRIHYTANQENISNWENLTRCGCLKQGPWENMSSGKYNLGSLTDFDWLRFMTPVHDSSV